MGTPRTNDTRKRSNVKSFPSFITKHCGLCSMNNEKKTIFQHKNDFHDFVDVLCDSTWIHHRSLQITFSWAFLQHSHLKINSPSWRKKRKDSRNDSSVFNVNLKLNSNNTLKSKALLFTTTTMSTHSIFILFCSKLNFHTHLRSKVFFSLFSLILALFQFHCKQRIKRTVILKSWLKSCE